MQNTYCYQAQDYKQASSFLLLQVFIEYGYSDL